MNRREFLKLLGIGTTTVVTIGTGIWTPPERYKTIDVIQPNAFPYAERLAKERDDLLDIVCNIRPIDTLYMSGFEHVPKSRITHEWLVETLT